MSSPRSPPCETHALPIRPPCPVQNKEAKPNSFAAGRVPTKPLLGNIEFHDVHFSYPTRSDVAVFHNLSLSVSHGSVLAVVGGSGSGKSTLTSLLLRYYDPEEGEILVDGMNIRELNPTWLRQQIGIVSQVGSC